MFKRIMLFLSLIVSCACAMDIVEEDGFSKLPNKLRRLCIFPLLKATESVHEARILLHSIASVSKKSYEQINCPFFIRDTIKLLSQKYKDPDKVIAYQLGMSGAMRYDKMCDALYTLTTDRTLEKNVTRDISYWISQGAWLNAHYGVYGVSLLAQAVQTAHVSFVDFLIKNGADVNVCNFIGHYVRDCNIIYNKKWITQTINALLEVMFAVESRNRLLQNTRISVAGRLAHMKESKILKNALAIDALLEGYQSKTCVKNKRHPLLKRLKDSMILCRLFQYLYQDECQAKGIKLVLPLNVRKCLEHRGFD